MTEVHGPKGIDCPDCGYRVIQFLVGIGTFCLGCGRLRGKIKDPSNPWVTIDCDAEPADQLPKMEPDAIRKRAVDQCLDGSLGPIEVHHHPDNDPNDLAVKAIKAIIAATKRMMTQ